MDISKKIGQSIRQYREDREISIRKLAKEVGVTEGTIRHYETGRQIPPIERIEEIARVLKINPYLLLVDGEKLPLVEKVIIAAERLPPEDLQMAEDLLQRLLRDQSG